MTATSARLIAYRKELTDGGLPPDTVEALVLDAAHIEVSDRGLRVASDVTGSHPWPARSAVGTDSSFVDQYSNPRLSDADTKGPELH